MDKTVTLTFKTYLRMRDQTKPTIYFAENDFLTGEKVVFDQNSNLLMANSETLKLLKTELPEWRFIHIREREEW